MAQQGESEQSSAVTRADGPWTVRRLLAWIAGFLGERDVDAPRRTAEILLAEVLGVERLRLYMEPDRELQPAELASLRALVARAGRHEPVQYLVGHWPFLGRDFRVAPSTLIPRPCTEVLVEHALAWYRARGAGPADVLDLCTGTGCIAASLALGMRAIARPSSLGCRPLRAGDGARGLPVIDLSPPPEGGAAKAVAAEDISVIATDVVADAVALARENCARLGAHVECRVGDLWSAVRVDERFDLIASNPPYVTDAEYAELDRNVREYEPATALRGGRDGLDLVRRVIDGAERHLRPGGLLLVEIGWRQGEAARSLVARSAWQAPELIKDGDGIDRVLAVARAVA
jgi:release factor glutamine methyltransferase